PSVTLTARASCSTPSMILALAFSLNSNCFAAMSPPRKIRALRAAQIRFVGLLLGSEHAEHVVFAQDGVFRAVDLDVGAAVLADEHAVALLHFHGDALALFGHAAGTDGND